MAKFCTKCGRALQEGEVCNCSAAPEKHMYTEPDTQNQQPGNVAGNEYNQQPGQQPGNPYNQQAGNMAGNPYNQQPGQQMGNPYNQQPGQQAGNMAGNPYNQQAGNMAGNPYNQQAGQQMGNPYNQQTGNMGGNPYNQQGMTREAEWFNEKKKAVVSVTKNMFVEIGPILKRPVSSVKKLAAGNDPAVGIEFIAAKAVVFILITLLLLAKVKDVMGIVGGYIEIPYFKILMLVLLFTAGTDFLEALLLKVFTGVFNGIARFESLVNVVGARALYDTLIAIVTGVLALLSIKVAAVVAVLAVLITPYVEYHGYVASVQLDEDKKVYAYFVVKVCISVLIMLITYLLVKDMASGVTNSVDSLFSL